MNSITLNLTEDDVKFIHAVLSDLPTKSGAWPLTKKIEAQATQQAQEAAANDAISDNEVDAAVA